MINWLVENSLGLFPPVLLRHPRKMEKERKVFLNNTKECSVSYMVSIVPRVGKPQPATLLVRGYHWNDGVRSGINFSSALEAGDCYSIREVQKTRMTNFSCHDKTVLYMFIVDMDGKASVYHAHFSGCHSLRDSKVPLYRIELFHEDGFYRMDREPSHDLVLKSINIKSKSKGLLHYYWGFSSDVGRRSKHVLNFEIEGEKYCVYGFCCVFCIKEFESIDSLVFHISRIHSGYECIQKEKSLYLKKSEAEAPEASRTLTYLSRRYRRKGLESRKDPTDQKTSESFAAGVWSIDTLSTLINRNIESESELPENSLALMKKWNTLTLHGNVFMDDIAKFVRQERKSPSVVDLLLVLYHKSVINPKELTELIYSLLEKDLDESKT
ncbi:uncharacterized protein Eint_011120 [Encephalitozoon intestinalis ATCC 50506]|uniref:C2H2-type domain-containing protein n=1 Tax=Encephalitozoon intestinalis (strain ATCC 50506) TaxID=876142 RepID=E0S5I9_ENCIT|nr:uncharacterized protein Eint_011120 [Encephalitozoon intestinalis ATCC 50506]ADM10974.1 hypothetical protein Eint_011120 [Encephalitozoon intestinalis ATCC 50506]UTX44611.1 FeS cluster assembly protein [Encephalitozoon intestinalis]